MKNQTSFRFPALAAAAVVAFASLLPLDAFAAKRSTKITGPRNGTVQTEVTRSPGAVQKSTTYTSPTGQVRTRDASRSYDPATGSVTGSATTTLANGKTATSSFTSTKTDSGRSTTGTHTGINGNTSTYDSTTTKTADGYTRQATATGPNGGIITRNVDVTHQDGTTTRTATVTKSAPPTP